ncbi:MAG: hypothetical protein Tsb0034_30260 [Ekhidna sp.]
MKESNASQDELLRSLFNEVEVKEGLNITEKVMQQVSQTSSDVFAYKPLISKKAWIGICTFFGLAVGYLFFTLEPSGAFVWDELTHWMGGVSLRSFMSFDYSLSPLPELTMPYLSAIMAFNVIGLYFMWSYRNMKRT